ncbi:hypothetical protein JTB14_011165 [Gonioctena quinquepunctata]|nr:hypothetical protein JTB14_011165 [Gonioctena quinquepunctata]
MKGEAATWMCQYGQIFMKWEFFMNRFFGRFNNPEVITKLTSKLYGKNQTEHEKVDCFVMEKVALANRLIPGIPEEQLISLISQLVLPRIRAYLRGRQISNIEEFIQLCTGIEGDTKMWKPETIGNTNHAISNNVFGGMNANNRISERNVGFRGAPANARNSQYFRDRQTSHNFNSRNVENRSFQINGNSRNFQTTGNSNTTEADRNVRSSEVSNRNQASGVNSEAGNARASAYLTARHLHKG